MMCSVGTREKDFFPIC